MLYLVWAALHHSWPSAHMNFIVHCAILVPPECAVFPVKELSVPYALKPKFFKPALVRVINATKPFKRPSVSQQTSQKCWLVAPFSFDIGLVKYIHICHYELSSSTASLVDNPSYIHTDHGSPLMSKKRNNFRRDRDMRASRTKPYNSQGNEQVERLTDIIWRTITLALKSWSLEVSQREKLLSCFTGSGDKHYTTRLPLFKFPQVDSRCITIRLWASIQAQKRQNI